MYWQQHINLHIHQDTNSYSRGLGRRKRRPSEQAFENTQIEIISLHLFVGTLCISILVLFDVCLSISHHIVHFRKPPFRIENCRPNKYEMYPWIGSIISSYSPCLLIGCSCNYEDHYLLRSPLLELISNKWIVNVSKPPLVNALWFGREVAGVGCKHSPHPSVRGPY